MPDDTTPAGGTAPAATAPPVAAPPAAAAPPPAAATPPAAPAPAAAPTGDPGNIDPNWLGTRLERARETEREKVLRELGAENLDAAKAAVAAANAAADAKKTAEQRNAELALELKRKSDEAAALSELTKEQAGRMMMALTPEQRTAVTNFAGNDPVQQLRAIQSFGPTWAKEAVKAEADAAAAAAAASATTPPAGTPPAATPPAATPPAQTAPAPGAPSGAQPGSPPDHTATYRSLASTNPFAAAAYGLSNPQAYGPTTN